MRRARMVRRRHQGDVPVAKESKSIYERMTGRKNPEWADKIYNAREFPSLYERITGKRPR